jgi:formate-dependent nitrite reductase membrane component NrfD
MMWLAEPAQHFVRAPGWTWYILFYFFFAGLSGGTYVIATLLRLRGEPTDEPAARLGYYASFVTLLVCPVMLILDLGSPLRFWHMLWNTTPGDAGPIFKYWSPMSVGAWGLLVFGALVTVSFVDTLVRDGKLGWLNWVARLLDGVLGKVVMIAGALFGLFIAGYTGVLLAVSNQPVWSDSWTLGGLFLASGMSGSVALLLFLLRYRAPAETSAGPLTVSERLYAVLELALIVIFAITLVPAGTFDLAFAFPWILLWLVALAGLAPGIGGLLTSRLAVTPEGVAVPVHTASAVRSVAVPVLILLGVLALRAAVIFGVQ